HPSAAADRACSTANEALSDEADQHHRVESDDGKEVEKVRVDARDRDRADRQEHTHDKPRADDPSQVVPARILGAKKQRLKPKEAVGHWTVGGALSAVAMTPGFILDRIGLILLGVPNLHALGFVLLSIGTELYAAGMSSVKAVKLSMKLEAPA